MKKNVLFKERNLLVFALIGALSATQGCGKLTYVEPGYYDTGGSAQLPSRVSPLPTKIPLKADCTKVSEAFGSDSAVSKINWHANKSTATGLVAVDGTWGFDAILYKETAATDYVVKLRFDMASLNSGVDVRNQRIRDIVFGSATGYQLEFTAPFTAANMRTINNLAVGQASNVTLAGNINLLGKSMALQIPVTITRAAAGYDVKSAAGFNVKLLTVFGLQNQITQLSTLCGAAAQDVVNVDFAFSLAKSCP